MVEIDHPAHVLDITDFGVTARCSTCGAELFALDQPGGSTSAQQAFIEHINTLRS